MSPETERRENESKGWAWWWILPWLAALLAGLLYYLWMRRRQGDVIEPVRIDLSFFRGQDTTETSARQAAVEIVREIERETQKASAETGTMPAAESVAEPVVEAEESAEPIPDDLTVISGIGPKTAAVLQSAGLDTFTRLAEASVDHLQEILLAANLRLGDPTTWPEQARLAAAGKFDEIKDFMARRRGEK